MDLFSELKDLETTASATTQQTEGPWARGHPKEYLPMNFKVMVMQDFFMASHTNLLATVFLWSSI